MKLPEYSSFSEKEKYFISETIDTVDAFEKKHEELSQNNDLIFRGVHEAKYKIYTSGQRYWITNSLASVLPSNFRYIDFIGQLIRTIRENTILENYYKSLNVCPNDFLYLTFLQHYGAPTPMLDFTSNIDKGLFFAFDGIRYNQSYNNIDDYISLYYIDKRRCGDELTDIVQLLEKGLNNGKEMYEDYIRQHPDADGYQRLLSDVDEFTRWFGSLSSIVIGFLDNPLQSHKLTMYKTGQQLLWSNLNIIAQEGCLVMYNDDSLPMEGYFGFKKEYIPKINCLNIHKSLAEYIKSKINLSRSTMYPQEEELAKNTIEGFMKKL